MEQTALIVSVIAVAIALASAAFTGWQAFEVRRARVDPLRASWTFASREGTGWRQHQRGWSLKNTGGTSATDVMLRVVYTGHERPTRERTFSAEGPIAPGAEVRLAETENQPETGRWFVPREDGTTHWDPAPVGPDGRPESAAARRVVEQWAEVSWTDVDGKSRRARVALY